MAWVVDPHASALRESARRLLAAALDQGGYVQTTSRTLENRTRAVMGTGHPEGDRIVQASAEALACLARTHTALNAAAVAVGRINTKVWVEDPEPDA